MLARLVLLLVPVALKVKPMTEKVCPSVLIVSLVATVIVLVGGSVESVLVEATVILNRSLV
jgi:hypothetical protein